MTTNGWPLCLPASITLTTCGWLSRMSERISPSNRSSFFDVIHNLGRIQTMFDFVRVHYPHEEVLCERFKILGSLETKHDFALGVRHH